jgi:cell fate (sporulation/competence/biofilm development) regulator YlbF (YheA/YmcA/DUF963 family)
MEDATQAIARWQAVTAPLADPAVELDCEAFAEVQSAFSAMRQAGAAIDAGLLALMTALARQVRESAADSDDDISIDDGLEVDEYAEARPA